MLIFDVLDYGIPAITFEMDVSELAIIKRDRRLNAPVFVVDEISITRGIDNVQSQTNIVLLNNC